MLEMWPSDCKGPQSHHVTSRIMEYADVDVLRGIWSAYSFQL